LSKFSFFHESEIEKEVKNENSIQIEKLKEEADSWKKENLDKKTNSSNLC